MVIIAISFTFTTFIPRASAIDVEITSVTPTSQIGKVGDSVQILGTINVTDGLYRIWFDTYNVKEENATANNVNATFTVPKLPRGNYTITLQDVNINTNATTWFYIETAYYIEAKTPAPPEQLQQGDAVEIWVNITGGEPNKIYYANVSVRFPSPANNTYWTIVELSNTTTNGEGYNITTIYPDHFTGALPTRFTGTYTVAFNNTLVTDTFFIGLTDRSEYRRNQLVNVKAIDYEPSENVTVKMQHGATIVKYVNVTATEEGTIAANFTIPSNASIGTYTINITSTPTVKNPPDIQNFTVPGFNVNITTKNLAAQPVPDVEVRVYEYGESVANATSDADGLAQIKLEIGNYTASAYYREEKVGERWINVTEAVSVDFYCNLTNLRISVVAVVDSAEISIPEAAIYLVPENKTFTTNINGTATAHSLLPNMSYTINASRYDMLFNTTDIPTLLVNNKAEAWYNMTIVVPMLNLRVNVTKTSGESISNVEVRVLELIGGIYFEGNTNTQGMVTFNCPFGKYTISVYDADEIKLDETTVNLFQNQTVLMRSSIYGLTFSVKVVDYFGQPIPNANVTLLREGQVIRSSITQSDGAASFDSVTGGELRITVYLSGQAQPSLSQLFYVSDLSPTIGVKLERYIVLAGFLIDTSILSIVIIIVATIILALLVELYRRRKLKTKTGTS